MIPKIIHQVWFGPRPVPTKWTNTWRDAHPGWEYKLWRESDVLDLGLRSSDHIRLFLDAGIYDAAADVARVGILVREGGIYIDADAECLRPLDDAWFMNSDAFVCAEETDKRTGDTVANGFMGAKPNHPFFLAYANALVRLNPQVPCKHGHTGAAYDCAWRTTGPELLKRVMARHSGVEVLPAWTFFTHTNRGAPVKGGPGWATHHWGSTGERSGGYFTFKSWDEGADPDAPAPAPARVYTPARPKVSLLLPTRERPEVFRRMYESALETISDESELEVVAVFDDDDTTRDQYPEGPVYITVPAGSRISALWNVAYGLSTGDVLQLGNDDLIFRSPNWDVAIRNALYSWPDHIGMVYPNDLYKVRKEPPYVWASNPFVTREWVEAVGFMTPPYFPMCWGVDTWVFLLAEKAGRCKYLKKVVIEQMHAMAGKAEMDANYKKGAFGDPAVRRESNRIVSSLTSRRKRDDQVRWIAQRIEDAGRQR